jgi:glutaredoxin 3
MPRIVMYATSWCPYCARARRLLDQRGLAFEEIDTDIVPGARAEMVARSGGRKSVPQVFIDDAHIGGSDELQALDASGGLEALTKS